MTKPKNYEDILCPKCARIARCSNFNEIPICNIEDANFLNCVDCPINWEKLRVKN